MKRFLQITALLLFLSGISPQVYAEEGLRLHEQEIKVGLLYNFLKYIEWPQSDTVSATSITVCIFGDDPFGGYLQPMAGRTVNKHPITIRYIHDIQSVATCQLLYVNADEKEHWPQLLKFLVGKNVLTVSDFREFANSGGMIEFGLKDDRINVQMNIDAVEAARLRVEDRLLKLATIVHSASPESEP